MSNEIRRTKTKLALMEQDGCSHLLTDAMKLVRHYGGLDKETDEYYIESIEELRNGYKQFLEDNNKEMLNQTELDFKEK